MAKIDDLLNDPDFLSLPEDEQNSFIDEMRQHDFGEPPNSGNLLQRAISSPGRYSPFESAVSFSVGGLPAVSGGATRAEDVGVPATQLISSFIPGFGVLGSTAATSASEGIRQGIRSLRGEGYNPRDIGVTAGTTLGTELGGKVLGKFLFGKAPQRAALKSKGVALGKMQEKLASTGEEFSIPKEQILDPLEKTFNKIKVPFGQQAAVLRRWINRLSDPEITHIDPATLMEFEDDLTESAKFAKKEGGNIIQQHIAKRAANRAAKDIRVIVSAKVDEAAARAGMPEFEKMSKEVSRLKSATKEKGDAFRSIGNIADLSGGYYLGNLFGHPIGGVLMGLVDMARRDPSVQNALFSGISKSGGGKVTKVGISELLRRTLR